MKCHSCAAQLKTESIYRLANYVSSDCQLIDADLLLAECDFCGLAQKVNTSVWSAACETIYSNYKIYHQADGDEQKVLDKNGSGFGARSDLLTTFLQKTSLLPKKGSILDIGCGNGAFLKTFYKSFPDWKLVGSELNRSFKEDIELISENSHFIFSEELFNTDEVFDVVTLIHCIEHIPSPAKFISSLRKLLASSGILLIEVPDGQINPFDQVIADHASHFSKQTLVNIVEEAGLEVVESGNLVLGKEITLLARESVSSLKKSNPKASKKFLSRNIHWLVSVANAVKDTANGKPVSIFGSSIAASWIYAQLEGKVNFFVDEDPARIGRFHLGKKIINISQLPKSEILVLALEPSLAHLIKARMLGEFEDLKIVVPPFLRD